jgi:hypothetical protein
MVPKRKSSLRILSFLLICSFISSALLAEDAMQFLPDSSEIPKEIEKSLDGFNEGDSLLPDMPNRKELVGEDADIPAFPGTKVPEMNTVPSVHEENMSYGVTLPDTKNTQGKYLEYKNRDIVRGVQRIGTKYFSFVFLKDDFDYKSSNNSFERTYRDKHSDTALILRLKGGRYITRGTAFDFSWRINIGVGRNGGKGRFVDGAGSDADFKLWTIPVDIGFALETSFWRLMKFGVSAGPSVMGIIQNRSDLEDGDKRKNIRQMSPGYFATGTLKLSLSEIFSSDGVGLLSAYSITNFHLIFDARIQSYSNFKSKDVSISGTSFGVGFAFEYF